MITIKLVFALFTLYSGCNAGVVFYDLKGGNVEHVVVPAPSGASSPNYIWKLSDNVSEADFLSACQNGHRVDSIS